MNRLLRTLGSVVVLMTIAITFEARADDRPAEAILADLNSVQYPEFDQGKREDQAYMKDYMAKRHEADLRRADLILELYKSHPENEKAQALMPRRWAMMLMTDDSASEAKANKEMDEIIAADAKSKLAGEAQFLRAQIAVQKNVWGEKPDLAAAGKAVDDYIKIQPEDIRAADLLGMLAEAQTEGSKEQLALYERIRKDYPKSSIAKYSSGTIRRNTSVGKPFELSFHNAINDETVDLKDLHGKVVVIDFWATWCGPCVGEMPHMKELYSKFHDKGVEFIGVSLDQPEDKGGLKALKKFVAEKEIPWPQYYQGNGWESDFSMSWGINSIPNVFVVGKDGNLKSVEARGKLEELIPKLLAE